jgi:hypothetical protein
MARSFDSFVPYTIVMIEGVWARREGDATIRRTTSTFFLEAREQKF